MQVVPVPVVCASIDEGRYFDVAFRFWVNASNNRTQTSFSVDRYMIHVPQYPVNSTVPAEYQYTIFVSRSVGGPFSVGRNELTFPQAYGPGQ